MNDYFPQRHPDRNVNDGCSCLVCRCSPLPSIGTNPLRIRLQRTQDSLSGIQHPRPGRPHTNYFFVDSDQPQPNPDPGDETPGSVACVYKLVTGPTGCPIATSTTVPTGGIGAIAIVDAGYYPTAQSDLDAFDSYFGIPATTITQVWPGPIRPPVYGDWEVEEALDIEWAHAMAPHAKLFLVVSTLCTSPQCATDPTWQAVQLAGSLVAAERRRRGEHELWRCGDSSGNQL